MLRKVLAIICFACFALLIHKSIWFGGHGSASESVSFALSVAMLSGSVVIFFLSIKAPRWCSQCKAAHSGDCPKKLAWVKPARQQSGRGGRPWQRKREFVFNRDNFLCQIHLHRGVLISVELHGVNAGICDHKKPLAEGGNDDVENLQTICSSCDKEKTAQESRRGRGG